MQTNNATSWCVADPVIDEVFDIESSTSLTAKEALLGDYDRVERLRMRLAESVARNRPLYICPICHVGVYLACRRCGDDKSFYFKHRHEDGNCPSITRSSLTKEEIDARKYNGLKEGHDHRQMKALLIKSLRRDPDFSDINLEKRWKGRSPSEWRKPDVSAVWRGTLRIAFEVQLSTTYLHVIAERRLFYKAQGGLLCWVFKTYDGISARLTQDDVFYNNNHNLFLVSEETLQASQQQRALVLDCRWTSPEARNGSIVDAWRGRQARFSELTQDLENQRVFLFDYDGERDRLVRGAGDDELRQQFDEWWLSQKYPQADERWTWLMQQLGMRGVQLPVYPNKIRGLLNALYSAKAGKPVGWGHPKFISVAHTIAGGHKNILPAFRAALKAYDRAAQIKAEDQEDKWATKVKEYKERMRAGDPDYERERQYDPLIAFLFPEVWDRLAG